MIVRNTDRCPHYQLRSESFGSDGPPVLLAIRRCTLTERLVTLLRHSERGSALADKLVINADGQVFAFVGPDLDAVTQQTCTLTRCDESCTFSYKQHLAYFGIEDPQEETVTCDDEDVKMAKETQNAAR